MRTTAPTFVLAALGLHAPVDPRQQAGTFTEHTPKLAAKSSR